MTGAELQHRNSVAVAALVGLGVVTATKLTDPGDVAVAELVAVGLITKAGLADGNDVARAILCCNSGVPGTVLRIRCG